MKEVYTVLELVGMSCTTLLYITNLTMDCIWKAKKALDILIT